jgi:DNA polymerase-3 subunit delta
MARGGPTKAKPGAAVLRQVLQALEKKSWPPGLTVLAGEDLYHLDAAQNALVGALVPEEATDFALSIFSDGKMDTADLVAAARSIPMFAPQRIVLVRDVGIIEGDPKPLSAYAKSPPPNSHLIVRAPKLDLRRPLHKALAKDGRFLEFGAVPAGRLDQREIQEMAGQRGLKLGGPVIRFLIESCAGDLYRVSSELDKIDVWLGDDPSRAVTLEVAREVVCHGGVLSGWEVADAILERDESLALAAVRKLIESGEEPIRTIGGLAWRARNMIQGKAMLEKGRPAREVVSASKAWNDADRFLAALSRYTLEELMAFPGRLLEADRTLKSRSIDPTSVLESLVRDLISPKMRAPTAPTGGARIRRA